MKLVPFLSGREKYIFCADEILVVRKSGKIVTVVLKGGDNWDIRFQDSNLADEAMEKAMKFMLGII